MNITITKILLACLFLTVIGATSAIAFEDVTPQDAYTMATTDANVFILDVRTPAEWLWVGHPGANKLDEGAALAGKVINVSYKIDYKGGMIINPSFMSDVSELLNGSDNPTLITMCRSGKRSVAAATLLEENGFNALNMITGFQGGKDAAGYRTVSGWAIDGLPYNNSSTGGYAD
jgi:rhodanese-related sulfurtransferase